MHLMECHAACRTTGLAAVIYLILLVSETQCVYAVWLACVLYQLLNQNPYLPRGPGDGSATAVSAEAF